MAAAEAEQCNLFGVRKPRRGYGAPEVSYIEKPGIINRRFMSMAPGTNEPAAAS